MTEIRHVKIAFSLFPQDGYPPADKEGLWAKCQGEGYRIDNIPFFAWLVSFGDVVSASGDDGELMFERVLIPGGHSTVRVVSYAEESVPHARAGVEGLGCSTELSHISTLFSIDVPPHSDYWAVVDLLNVYVSQGLLDYEESCVQHAERVVLDG